MSLPTKEPDGTRVPAGYRTDVNTLLSDILLRVGDREVAYQAVARVAAELRSPTTTGALHSAADVWAHPKVRAIRRRKQEHFLVLLLNARHHVLRVVTVAIGTLTGVEVHPRELFRDAVRHSAAAIIAVHCHPSGDPSPSEADVHLTERLRAAGILLGIPLLDHVVVAANGYVSFGERGLL